MVNSDSESRSTNVTEGWTIRGDILWKSFNYYQRNPANDANIPASYDLRNVNGISYVTPVRNQNWHGLCWSFGAVASLESAILKQWNNFTQKYGYLIAAGLVDKQTLNLSEQFGAWHNVAPTNGWGLVPHSREDKGGWGFVAHYNFLRYGSPLENDFPFIGNSLTNSDGQRDIIFNPQTPDWMLHLIRPSKILYTADPWEIAAHDVVYEGGYDGFINTIKSALMKYGAMEVSFKVPSDFATVNGFYCPTSTGITVDGGHAVCLVGWDDAHPIPASVLEMLAANPGLREFAGMPEGETCPVWIVKNSWGEVWGNNGYYYVPMVSRGLWEAEFSGNEAPGQKEWWKVDRDWIMVSVFSSDTDYQKADFNLDGFVNNEDYTMLETILFKVANAQALTPAELALYDISLVKDERVNDEDYFEFINNWNFTNGN